MSGAFCQAFFCCFSAVFRKSLSKNKTCADCAVRLFGRHGDFFRCAGRHGKEKQQSLPKKTQAGCIWIISGSALNLPRWLPCFSLCAFLSASMPVFVPRKQCVQNLAFFKKNFVNLFFARRSEKRHFCELFLSFFSYNPSLYIFCVS